MTEFYTCALHELLFVFIVFIIIVVVAVVQYTYNMLQQKLSVAIQQGAADNNK